MTPSPSSQTPARVRWRWRWGRIVVLVVVAGIGALGWNHYTWDRAVRQLEEAGMKADWQAGNRGARLWKTAKDDWRQLLKPGTWRTLPIMWWMEPAKAGQLRNLDAIAPALRRINPEVLNLSFCPALESVEGLNGLTALQVLLLSRCLALENVDGLKGLTALKRLSLADCPALQGIDGLKGLTALQDLYLSGCPALQNVDGLKGLTALQTLWLSDCPALQDVAGLNGLTALRELDLRGCPKLPPEQVAALRAALPKADIQYP